MLVILLYRCMQKKGYVHPLRAHKTGFAPKMKKHCEVGEKTHHCSLM